MMRTVDRALIRAPIGIVFAAASDVERWPDILPHYRYVRFESRRADGGVVAMSAHRPFGPLNWPTWWTSEMWIHPAEHRVTYKHIRGITTGMDVEWLLRETPEGVDVTIMHEWTGPAWPLIRRPAAEWIIGPVFVHGIASRTLAGVQRSCEQSGASR
jgi:ribosome-associated toxin RatA of RatAB toxin-antitoxin module